MTAGANSGAVHVVGAGLAGLAAAVTMAEAGREVRLYEASGHAGGRCRSYFDAGLGCRVDNGNHLLLAGNRNALAYLGRIGARGTLHGPGEALFPFVDAANGERWMLRPNRGPVPWWILRPGRRVPGTRAIDYLALLRLRRAGPGATVGAALDPDNPLFVRLLAPLAVAALNTGVAEASASLFARLLADTLGRGGAACRPLAPRVGLSETFVDPALATLRRQGAAVNFAARLKALDFAGDRVARLHFEGGPVELAIGDSVILATPAAIAARLVPGLVVPDRYAPIVNAHFRCAAPPGSPLFVGVVAGAAEWIFRKAQVLSVTVSAAERLVACPADDLRETLWRDTAMAYRMPHSPAPPARIVKERRATFLASPDQLLRRPKPTTRWRNLSLAGDYTDTGLPATIEGAVASGFAAAALALEQGGRRGRVCPRVPRAYVAAATDAQQQQPDFS
jgi:hydroxysqualene dehydroxylase